MISSIISPSPLQVLEKWDLVVLDISRTGYFGLVLTQSFKHERIPAHTYLKEYLLYLSS